MSGLNKEFYMIILSSKLLRAMWYGTLVAKNFATAENRSYSNNRCRCENFVSVVIQQTTMYTILQRSKDCQGPNRKKEYSSWEHNLETKISFRSTEYFCAKSACA
jgi:hypothetical protein